MTTAEPKASQVNCHSVTVVVMPTTVSAPHTLSATEVISHLQTSKKEGLSVEEASERQKAHGPNRLPPPKSASIFRLFLKQFFSPLIYLLFIAAFITFLIKEYSDALVVLAVVCLNSCIGFFQELRAEKKMLALQTFLAPTAKVIRSGKLQKILAEELTVGDIVVIEAGDRVPADGRLIEAYQLACEEASFTGESVPTEKNTATLQGEVILSQQKNMAFMGAVVTSGSGQLCVTAIGVQTEIGRISELIKTAHETPSPLETTIQKLSRLLLIIILLITGGVITLGIFHEYPALEMIQVGVNLAVSAIPEGLPVVVTITLSIGLWRMAKQKSIIRKLDAVETLGSVDVICTDKTGTLTHGEMMVNSIVFEKETFQVTGKGFTPSGAFAQDEAVIHPAEHPQLSQVGLLALLATDARTEQKENGQYEALGDPTETSLYVLGQKIHPDADKIVMEYHTVFTLPFDQHKRWSVKVYKKNNSYLSVVQGSPEFVVALAKDHQWVLHAAQEYGKQGGRLVALACTETKENPLEHIKKDHFPHLDVVCLLSISDPLREDTPAAIQQCHNSGIRVMMITGDHPKTAQHIAEQIQLDNCTPLTGPELMNMSDDELTAAIRTCDVVARATPELKIRLIKILQNLGKVIAMTGDGVNDAPALKQADIGIAMGKTGSDVAISAADMVLTDDNFSSIVSAIKEGRVIWQNLRKVIFYLLSTSVGEILVICGALVFRLPLPLLAPQILWLNLITDGFLDVTLATEQPEHDVMLAKPRGKQESLLGKHLIGRLFFTGVWMTLIGLIFYLSEVHIGLEKARTMVLLNLAAIQWFNAWNARSEKKTVFEMPLLSNRALLLGLLCCISLQVLGIYWTPLSHILGTVPLSAGEWGITIAAASSIILADVLWKKGIAPLFFGQ